jgi:membrane protease YdiL (CAAX protease family)
MIYIFILGLVLAWCLIYTGSLWLTLGIHWGTNVAYQFFTNVITVRTVRETGLDNYILAGSYLLAWAAIVVLYKLRTFKIADPQEQNAG